jgi:hypothetical protein
LEHIGEDVNNITSTTIRNVYSVMIDNYESLKENDDFDEVFSKINNVVDELDLIQNIKTPKMVLTSSNKTSENLLSDYNNIELINNIQDLVNQFINKNNTKPKMNFKNAYNKRFEKTSKLNYTLTNLTDLQTKIANTKKLLEDFLEMTPLIINIKAQLENPKTESLTGFSDFLKSKKIVQVTFPKTIGQTPVKTRKTKEELDQKKAEKEAQDLLNDILDIDDNNKESVYASFKKWRDNINKFANYFKKTTDKTFKYNEIIDEYNKSKDETTKELIFNEAVDNQMDLTKNYDDLVSFYNEMNEDINKFYIDGLKKMININKLQSQDGQFYFHSENLKTNLSIPKNLSDYLNNIFKKFDEKTWKDKPTKPDVKKAITETNKKLGETYEIYERVSIKDLFSKKNFFDSVGKQMVKYVENANLSKNSDVEKPKGKTYISETIIKKEDEQIINDSNKKDIVNLIIKQRPDISKDELNKMTKNELIEVVKITSINLQDLFSLKIPKDATKEQIELIQNLENIKRQRDVEDEVKKLKEKFRGADALALEEEKNKLLQKSFTIVKKGVRNPVGFKNIVKKQEPINKAIKKAVNVVDKQIAVPRMNEEQVLGLGIVNDKNKIERNLLEIMKGDKQDEQVMKRKKKVARTLGGNNTYMNFMKQFREENKGKYSPTGMVKVGAQAYRNSNNMPDKQQTSMVKALGGNKQFNKLNNMPNKQYDWSILKK